jgi:hypothetical protein
VNKTKMKIRMIHDQYWVSNGRTKESLPRFVPSRWACPQCGQPAFQDEIPPNYSQCSAGANKYHASGSIKHVCDTCKIAFTVQWWEVDEGNGREKNHVYGGIVPLVERDGFYLTPHDVFMETEKVKMGKYPSLSWA